MISLQERAESYNKAFPKYPKVFVDKGFLMGSWLLGNMFKRQTKYYGAYPGNFLKRALSLFPDAEKLLHLFAGTIQPIVEINRMQLTYDINPEHHPTFLDDIRNVKRYANDFSTIDVVLADPPYDQPKDWEQYKQKPFDKRAVFRDLGEIMHKDSLLAWLDTIHNMYRKDQWKLVGTIQVIVSTHTRYRGFSIYQHV